MIRYMTRTNLDPRNPGDFETLDTKIQAELFLCLFKHSVLKTYGGVAIHLSMAIELFVWPWPLFQFLDHLHSRCDSLDGGSAQNKRTRTSILQVGFEPTIPAFERAQTVNASNGAATVIGWSGYVAPHYVNLGPR
jgi:hypothetical protein